MSDKSLQDSLLEAGILPKQAVEQMEQWRQVPKGSAEKVGEFSIERVNALREDIEIRRLPELRETILDTRRLMEEARPITLVAKPLVINGVMAGVDILGRYIIEIPRENQVYYNQLSAVLRNMTIIHDPALTERNRLITAIQVLWKTVEIGESRYEVPTHWFIMSEAPSESKEQEGEDA